MNVDLTLNGLTNDQAQKILKFAEEITNDEQSAQTTTVDPTVSLETDERINGTRVVPTKWRIPFPVKEMIDGEMKQSPRYNKACVLCRRHNLPYPEALKAEEALNEGRIEALAIEVLGGTAKPDESTDMPSSPTGTEVYTPDLPDPAASVKIAEPSIEGRMLDSFSSSDNIVGLYVRQTEPERGKMLTSSAMVMARKPNGYAEVRTGDWKRHTVKMSLLQVFIPPKMKARNAI